MIRVVSISVLLVAATAAAALLVSRFGSDWLRSATEGFLSSALSSEVSTE